MNQQNEFLPVNWMDGMKINKTHFQAQNHAGTYGQSMGVQVFLNHHNYGLLPNNEIAKRRRTLSISLDNEQYVNVRMMQCDAVTRGGHLIHFDHDTALDSRSLSAEVPGLSVPYEQLVGKSSTYFVVLAVDPYNRLPFGQAALDETPPRLPFTVPNYSLHLLTQDETTVNTIGPFQLPISKVILEDATIRLDEDYIPPCTAVNSHPELLDVHAGLEEFFGKMENLSLQILQKIRIKKQSNDLSEAVGKMCENLIVYTATEYSNFHTTYLFQPPVFMVSSAQGIARLVKNSMDIYTGTLKEDLVNYFTEWCGIPQAEFEGAITALCNHQYDHLDINESLNKVLQFTRIISTLFTSLASLDYIGKKREAGIFVKEQLLMPEVEMQAKKRRSFLAD
jgi:hypothetical protein